MGSVWKRLQRVNKRAAKFQFTASYHELRLETTAKWRPSNLAVVWTRRSRRVASAPLPWEPDMMNPLVGNITWPVPDNHPISVTLFKDPRTHELEDKDWTFVIEDITQLGKKRVLATASINMRKYASIESTQQSFTLGLKPASRKITAANLELTISCVFLREGKATDEDMQSVVSLMSVNNNCDVAPLDDLEDIPDMESSGDISDHLYDFTQQLEMLTTSLNGCMDPQTPLSVPSLSEDPTPMAEFNRLSFELESDQLHVAEASGGDELLKTPNATTMQQQRGDSTLEATAAVGKDKPTDKSLAKFFTSTPIAKFLERKSPTPAVDASLSASASSAEGSGAGQHTTADAGARKSLNFGASEKKNNKKKEKETVVGTSFLKIEEPMPDTGKGQQQSGQTANETAQQTSFGEKSTAIASEADPPKKTADAAALVAVKTVNDKTAAAINGVESSATLAGLPQSSKAPASGTTTTTTTTTTMPPTPQRRGDATKRSELLPLNLKKSYDSEKLQNVSGGTGGGVSMHNNNNNSTMTKPVEKIILKENTPGQDLLEWCKDVTKEYPNVKVTNLTTSWRNGMAFCAIIHHFEPDLVNMSQLTSHDVVGNCRIAFDAAESLGIPRVIEPRDMSMLAVPDKLAVMTYLHQLRAHFTGKQLHIEQIGSTSDESSYVIGDYKSDNLSQNIRNLSHMKANLLHRNSLDENIIGNSLDVLLQQHQQQEHQQQLSPTAKKDVKNLILSGSKNILGKVLSPTKEKNSINASQHGSQTPPATTHDPANVEDGGEADDNDERQMNLCNQENSAPNQLQQQTTGGGNAAPNSPGVLVDANMTNRILSRHKEMSEKAKVMMEKLKISNGERNENDEERQQRLREQARHLIQKTRVKTVPGSTVNGGVGGAPERNSGTYHNHQYNNGQHNSLIESPASSPTKLKRMNFSPERTISPIPNGIEDYAIVGGSGGYGGGGGSGSGSPKMPSLSPTKKITPPRDVETTTSSNKQSPSHRISVNGGGLGFSALQSFNSVVDRISPKGDKKGDKLSYIESELEALEREQEAIDQKASNLEKKLRAVMGGNPKTEETEEQLLSQWFTLVNKKNALLRRQMQLNILEQESDLERKYTMLNQELRAAQSVEDWRKTEAQREKERLLLEELVSIVDKRDKLVQDLHTQEIAIEDDQQIARNLQTVDISGGKEKCVIQ